MKTYEIKEVSVNHPELGELIKQNIIYYESVDDKGTPEFYKEGETEIRTGYIKRS